MTDVRSRDGPSGMIRRPPASLVGRNEMSRIPPRTEFRKVGLTDSGRGDTIA
jgi:hypothetical protein